MTSWHSYGKIYNLGHAAIADLLLDPVTVEEKVDGCFSPGTLVHLANGKKVPIKELFDSKYTGQVRCYDFESNTYVNGKVTNWFRYPSSHKKMVNVKIYGRNNFSRNSFTCTEDHLIFTQRGWVKAKDLTTNDTAQVVDESLSFLQEQMIIGTTLGDGYISKENNFNSRLVVSHSEKYHNYNELIAKILNKLFARFDKRKGGYPGSGYTERVHSKSSHLLNEIHKNFYSEKIKHINKNYLINKLSPIALAFWYMDDGSCSFTDKQQARPTLHTEGFSTKDCKNLQDILKQKFNLTCSINGKFKRNILQISAHSQERFFHLISPYIADDFKYKLPQNFRQIPCALNFYIDIVAETGRIFQPIMSVEYCQYSSRQYDLETEYQNYLVSTSGVLVHNSQFSFGSIDKELKAKSKSKLLVLDAPDKMFEKAVATVKELQPLLRKDWTYRGEYLQKPKHNALAYDRTPNNNIIIFDVNTGEEVYLPYEEKKEEANRLGLETVPLLFQGKITDVAQLLELLETTSILGGQKVEGIVIKNYLRFGRDGKALMGKHVSEAFKEVHKRDWKKSNPTGKDILATIGDMYRAKTRWNKAVLHMKEDGRLENSPRDIGSLIKEVQKDILEECVEEIKDQLFDWAKQHVLRAAIRGLPEWYKEQLMEKQFEKETNK